MEETQNLFELIRPYLNIPFALVSGYLFYKIHKVAKKTSHGNARWMGKVVGWVGMFAAGILFLYRAVQGFTDWFIN